MSNKTDPPGQIISKGEEGALHKPLYVERHVKIYPVQENELETISVLNTGVALFCSVASGTFGYMATIAWNMAVSTDQTTAQVGTGVIALCFLVILGSLGVAFYCWRRKKSVLNRILSESRVKDN